MLGEYKVSRCSRQCYALRRPLRDGEWYYSVVLESGEEFERRDYSAEGWNGPPEGAIGWWKSRMPTADEKRLVLAPKEVLIDLLRQMAEFPDKAKSRYLLALMLLRKRIVREAPPRTEGSDQEGDQTDKFLRIAVADDDAVIEVPVCSISQSESERIREELNELLYCEAEPS